MGQALVAGLLRSGWIDAEAITIAERYAETRHQLEGRFPGATVTDTAVTSESAVLAVKPQDAVSALDALAGHDFGRVVSIVAGLRIADLEKRLGSGTAVLRAMPNMPAVLGAGASGLAGGDSASEADYAWAEAVLSAFGVVARVAEPLLDAVTGLSGSGPAYVFLLAEALIDAGIGQGLDREVARLLTNQTILGAAKLLTELEEPAQDLRAAVTSPGGTTAAGVRQLERGGFRSTVIEAVAAATDRARELGEQG